MDNYYNSLPYIPYDNDGYVKSFKSNDTDNIKDFYDKYGFVVISNAISDKQADDSYNEIWNIIENSSNYYRKRDLEKEKSKDSKFTGFLKPKSNLPSAVNRNDINTWLYYWPYANGGRGIIGNGIVGDIPAWENRQSKELFNGFASVLGTNDLIVSCDRYGFMRPTLQIPFSSGIEDKHEWRTEESWVHWDLNPWYWSGVHPIPKINDNIKQMIEENWKLGRDGLFITENNDVVDFKGYDKVQGLVALIDSKKDDGGFCCVPGFQKIIKQWSETNSMYNKGHFVEVKKDDKLIDKLQKIPMRKGSLVIWSSCLPHCNYPNTSSNPRACQYIKMFPKEVIPENIRNYRKQALKKILPEEFKYQT